MIKKNISLIFIFLFLLMPIGVNAESEVQESVILGGEPFGIKMFSEGLLIIKTQPVITQNGKTCPVQNSGIRANDVIISADGVKVRSNEQLSEIIRNSCGKSIELKLIRDETYISTEVTPVMDIDGIYRLGLWVRDSAAGLGTITFYSTDHNGFCGLGHGICDRDTGKLITISSGDVDSAYISSVTKSKDGKIGTLNGYFSDDDIGEALENSNKGIYGKALNIPGDSQILEIADKDEIKTGKAYLYTTVEGSTPKEYEINIENLCPGNHNVDMTVKITDAELLSKTGGIVQGMSGSPIVQNGKLIGALTHVIIEDVEYGYAIYAETMFENLENVCG